MPGMARPRGMISPSGRGILSSRGLVSPNRWDSSYGHDMDGDYDRKQNHNDDDNHDAAGGGDDCEKNSGMIRSTRWWKERS